MEKRTVDKSNKGHKLNKERREKRRLVGDEVKFEPLREREITGYRRKKKRV